MNKYIGLITRCKDEYFVCEFAEYYLYQGIDHIYIIDDDSNNKSIYEDLTLNDKVTVIYGKDITKNNYADVVYKEIKNNYEWIIYVDVDEFITTKKNITKTIREEMLTTFNRFDCVKIPWVMMGSSDQKVAPKSILKSNVYRWNHDKKHPHPNKIHKFRCRYEQIEVKCIFRTKFFDSIWDHHPKSPTKKGLFTVNAVDCVSSPLMPFMDTLREEHIENGFLLCYHYRITSTENSINKLKTNRWYIDNRYTIDDLMLSDYNEIKDETLRLKSISMEVQR